MSHVQEMMFMISYLLPVFHSILITILSYLITNLELWLFIQLYLTVLVLYMSSLICQILSTTHVYMVRLQAILPYFSCYNIYYRVNQRAKLQTISSRWAISKYKIDKTRILLFTSWICTLVSGDCIIMVFDNQILILLHRV